MKEQILTPSIPTIILFILLLPSASFADPRSQTVKIQCGSQLAHDPDLYVPNFAATKENITTQIRTSGFGTAITGTGLDTNYGLAQCYRDLSLPDCVTCYVEARTILPQCYPANGGRVFLDGCFMRAENHSFFPEYSGPNDTTVCGDETRKDLGFQGLVKQAMEQMVKVGPSNGGFLLTDGPVYMLADCWRTVNSSSCRDCLENAAAGLLGCLPWSEGRALNTGCFVRYSDVDFLNRAARNGSSRGTVVVIVVAVVSAVAVVIIGAAIGVYMWKQRVIRNKRKGSGDAAKFAKILTESSLNFKYSTLEKATCSFSEANKLGQGGFGTVYKGVLQDGREIAVKRLFFNSKHRAGDFYNEVKIISNADHKNLARLLGCSCSGPESLLVYEFLPNKSLDGYIFDSEKGKSLNWNKRLEIIVGTAEGLVYLHENTKARIIHRDIKASNILLDSRMRAKIADFGLVRSFQEDKSHISTGIAGTLGYMAPEYLAHGQLTEKADVYSFGVLLLEIATGRQSNRSKTSGYADNLVTIAWKHFQQGKVEELFDPNLMLHNYHNAIDMRNEILRVVHVGLLCTQKISSLRPSMSKALQMLVKKEEGLPAPTSPPFVDESTVELDDFSKNRKSPLENGRDASIASISQSIFYPR